MNYRAVTRPSRVTPSRHTLRGERLIRVSSGEPSLAERESVSCAQISIECIYIKYTDRNSPNLSYTDVCYFVFLFPASLALYWLK
jgi:hypothetical protein